MLRTFLFNVLLFVVIFSPAQAQTQAQIGFNAPFLIAGTGPVQLTVNYSQQVGPNMVVRWNGADRPTTAQGSIFALLVSLTAADIASPQLAEVTVCDTLTGAILASAFLPVVYNVAPDGVVYDPHRSRFYVVTPPDSQDSRFPPNSIVALDPETGEIGPIYSTAHFMGEAALSDDGSALYVVGEADGVIRKFDPDTLTLIGSFPFRDASGSPSTHGFGFKSSIAVMPGHPDTIAINYAPTFLIDVSQAAIFDSGNKRPSEIETTERGILFSPDGKFVFAFGYPPPVGGMLGPAGLLRLALGASGLSPAGLLPGGAPVALVNGSLFTSTGLVLDPNTMLLTGNLGIGGATAVDAANQRVLVWQSSPESLNAFNLAGLQPLGSISLPNLGYFPAAQNPVLLRFGSDGVLYTWGPTLLLFHTPLAGPAPATIPTGVVNSASGAGGPIAPGELLSLYGTNLGPATPAVPALVRYQPEPFSLAHVQVWFDDFPAPVLLAYQNQLNVIAPFELKPGSTVYLQVWYFGIPSVRIPLTVTSAAPGLFTADGSGAGQVAVVNQDGTVDQPSTPGAYISLYGTGGGALPGAADGVIAYDAVYLTNDAQITIDGQNAFVSYAGAAPTLPDGVIQINAVVPPGVRTNTKVPLVLSIGGKVSTQEVTLAIH